MMTAGNNVTRFYALLWMMPGVLFTHVASAFICENLRSQATGIGVREVIFERPNLVPCNRPKMRRTKAS